MPEPRFAALLATVLLVPFPTRLPAQYALGVGVTVPTGGFADAASPGWMLAAGYSPWRSDGGTLRLWLQGYYGENTADDLHQADTQMGMAGVGLSVKPLPRIVNPSPYLIGTVGYLNQWTGGGREGAIYLGGGAGISVGRHWLQARYQASSLDAGSLGFVVIAAGTSF